MHRRAFVATVSLSPLVAWLTTDAKAVPQARVAWLMPAVVSSDLEYFRRGLRELGWAEGENVVIEQRYADARPEHLPQLAADLARLKVDVFVTAGTAATDAARGVTQSVPVVFVLTDPIGKGWIDSLSHPGGKLTGLSMQNDELHLKMLEVLHEAFPRITRGWCLSRANAIAIAISLRDGPGSAGSFSPAHIASGKFFSRHRCFLGLGGEGTSGRPFGALKPEFQRRETSIHRVGGKAAPTCDVRAPRFRTGRRAHVLWVGPE